MRGSLQPGLQDWHAGHVLAGACPAEGLADRACMVQASPLVDAEREEASRNVAAVARKAHSLYRQQLQIEEQVDKRYALDLHPSSGQPC